MSEFENALPAEGGAKPAQNPENRPETHETPPVSGTETEPAAGPGRPGEPLPWRPEADITGRDKVFTLLTGCFCLLLVNTAGWPWGMCDTLLFLAWYLLLLGFMGREPLCRRRESRVLLGVNLALAATFALTSNPLFRLWNFLALMVLVPVQALSLSAGALLPWWRPAMLWERFLLAAWGLFGNLWVPLTAAFPERERREERNKRTLPLVLGTAGALALVAVLAPVLMSADALFAASLEALRFPSLDHLEEYLGKLFWTLVLTPFAFSFLYSLRHPRPLSGSLPEKRTDGLSFLLMLAALDGLYLLFLAVQSAGLFGGPEYLARRGVSYAEWARSGFFQMVGVTVVNLTVTLAGLTFSRREGRTWTVLRLLSALLAGESLLLLASAAWRMTLYVSAYGLSFKRCMTYWGMVMMALFFLAALWKLQKPDRSFCRLAFPLALAGWLVINCVPLDYLVAKDQVDRYLACEARGGTPNISVSYLLYDLSYDTLPQLARLDSRLTFYDWRTGREEPLGEMLERRREEARQDCADWRSWSLSACIAAGG